MKRYAHRAERGSMFRAVSVMVGVVANVLLAFISYKTDLPR